MNAEKRRPTMQHPSFNSPHLGPEAGELALGPLAIVVGCGHAGLPLGLASARKGYSVDLVDACAERVEAVNAGRMPFHEEGADELLAAGVRDGRIRATQEDSVLGGAGAVIVTIGTPVDEYL